MATTKARAVLIILINTTKQNVWLQQPVLATELFTVEYHQIAHMTSMELKGDDVDISFLFVVPDTIRVQSEQVEVTSTATSSPNSTDKPTFGPRPNTQATNFDFGAEVQCLSIRLNLGDEWNIYKFSKAGS